MRIPRTLAVVLAGGKGSRLSALTDDRAKPVLPIGGTYRLIDVGLSNLAHSHISDVWLVQQYLPHSLNDYLSSGRPWDMDRNHGGLQIVAPFQGGHGEGFGVGNSDSLYRQRNRIAEHHAELVLVVSADHLYTLNFLEVITTHLDREADLTIVTVQTPDDPSQFGVVHVDDAGTVTGFDYKPDEPDGDLIAAEIFLYRREALVEALDTLVETEGELGDYGDDLVPWFVQHRITVEHRMSGYWKDLGTLEAYWSANLQLIDGNGARLDDPAWPIRTAAPQLLPAHVDGEVSRSLIAAGATVRGRVTHSVVGPEVVVDAGASVRDSVLLGGVRLGDGVELTNCIVDAGAVIDRAGPRGTADQITLIGPDGLIADRVDRAEG